MKHAGCDEEWRIARGRGTRGGGRAKRGDPPRAPRRPKSASSATERGAVRRRFACAERGTTMLLPACRKLREAHDCMARQILSLVGPDRKEFCSRRLVQGMGTNKCFTFKKSPEKKLSNCYRKEEIPEKKNQCRFRA